MLTTELCARLCANFPLQLPDAPACFEMCIRDSAKVMAFTTNKLDPLFENNDLKASGTGIYQEVFDTVDYDGVSGADVVDTLLDGMESVGYTIG